MAVCSVDGTADPMSEDRAASARDFFDEDQLDGWTYNNYRNWWRRKSDMTPDAPGLWKDEMDALEEYMEHSATLNYALRTGEELTEAQMLQISRLDAALDSAPELSEDIVVWRSAPTEFVDFPPGTEFVDDAYVSTSLKLDVAEDFAFDDNTITRIVLPRGAKVGYLGMADNIFAFQEEMLIPRGARFRVIGMRDGELWLELVL